MKIKLISGWLGCVMAVGAFASTEQDLPTIIQTLNTVLETYPMDKRLIWQNHATGNYGEIYATTVLKDNCRLYERTWVFEKGVELYEGEACRDEKQVWKPIRDQRLRRDPLTEKNDPLLIAKRKEDDRQSAIESAKQKEVERKKAIELEKLRIQAENEKRAAEEIHAKRDRIAQIEMLKKQQVLEEIARKKVEEERLLAEALKRKAQLNLQTQEAIRLAKEAEVDAQRIQQEIEQQLIEAQKIKQEKWVVLGWFGLAFLTVLTIIGFIIRFFRGPYWQERKVLKSLLTKGVDYKKLYGFVIGSETVRPESDFEYLCSICVLEEHIEDQVQLLSTSLEIKPYASEKVLSTLSGLIEQLSHYDDMAAYLIVKNLIHSRFFTRRLIRQWTKQCQSHAAQITQGVQRLGNAIRLYNEVQSLTPQIKIRSANLNTLQLDQHLTILLERKIEFEPMLENDKGQYGSLLKMLSVSLKDTSLPTIAALADIPQDLDRINQIKAIIDLYNEKIKAVEKDDALDEDDKLESSDYLKRLRERDIDLLEAES